MRDEHMKTRIREHDKRLSRYVVAAWVLRMFEVSLHSSIELSVTMDAVPRSFPRDMRSMPASRTQIDKPSQQMDLRRLANCSSELASVV